MYDIIPKLFGRENITFSFRDTELWVSINIYLFS